jgi:hypothetical protein
MVPHELAQLAENVGVPAAPELGLQAALGDQQTKVLQAGGDRRHAGLVVEVRERRTRPQVERESQRRRRLLEVSTLEVEAALLRPALEAVQVERVRSHLDEVAVSAGRDRVLAQHLAQMRDGALDEVGGARRRSVTPDLVDQAMDRNHHVGLGEQQHEQRPVARSAEVDRAPLDDRLQRTEHAVFDPHDGSIPRGLDSVPRLRSSAVRAHDS